MKKAGLVCVRLALHRRVGHIHSNARRTVPVSPPVEHERRRRFVRVANMRWWRATLGRRTATSAAFSDSTSLAIAARGTLRTEIPCRRCTGNCPATSARTEGTRGAQQPIRLAASLGAKATRNIITLYWCRTAPSTPMANWARHTRRCGGASGAEMACKRESPRDQHAGSSGVEQTPFRSRGLARDFVAAAPRTEEASQAYCALGLQALARTVATWRRRAWRRICLATCTKTTSWAPHTRGSRGTSRAIKATPRLARQRWSRATLTPFPFGTKSPSRIARAL